MVTAGGARRLEKPVAPRGYSSLKYSPAQMKEREMNCISRCEDWKNAAHRSEEVVRVIPSCVGKIVGRRCRMNREVPITYIGVPRCSPTTRE